MAFLGGIGKLIGKAAGLAGGPASLLSIGAQAAGLLSGLGQGRKGKKMLAGLKDPGYQIPDEFRKNVAESEQMARQGMPTEQYNQASGNIQRGTQSALRQLGRMSNPFAGIAAATRNQQDAFANLDAQNAAARRQNMMQAMGARREMANQKLMQQQYAQQGYMNNVNQANALIGAGRQNVAGALGGLANFGMYKDIYKGGGNNKLSAGDVLSGLSQMGVSVGTPLSGKS